MIRPHTDPYKTDDSVFGVEFSSISAIYFLLGHLFGDADNKQGDSVLPDSQDPDNNEEQ